MTEEFFSTKLRVPAIGIARRVPAPEIADRCAVFWNAGVELVEVTIERPEEEPALAAAVAAGRARSALVGAGSVRTRAQLERAVQLGAAFVVGPGLSRDVALEASTLGVPYLPGVATASEIIAALDLGCTWLKAFPAAVLGPAWVAAQLAPFPDVRLVATGGITAANATAFLDAGAAAVGLGSSMPDADVRSLLQSR